MTLVRRLFSIAAWFFLALAPLPSSVGMAADRPLRYHSEPEITAWLKALPLRDPNLVQYRSIGTSNQGRDLGLVTLTAGPVQLRNPKPAIIINATHHGDEKIATESALHFIETLIVDQDKPEVTAMLSRFVFYVQPLVNPDGHAGGTRADAAHRDINRDYSYPLRSDRLSFKTREARAVRDLIDSLDVGAAIALHSGTDGVLWPWCFTKEAPPDAPFLMRLAWRTARSIGTVARQSHHDYPSSGEFSDFVYWRQQAPALTIEVDRRRQPHPSQINTISARTTRGIFEFMNEFMKAGDSPVTLSKENNVPRAI